MFEEVVLACSVSVHCPILLETCMKIGDLLFLFEIIWLHEKDFSLCQRLVGLKEQLVDGWVFSWLIN